MIYAFVVSFVIGVATQSLFGFGWGIGALLLLVSSAIYFVFVIKKETLNKLILVGLIGLSIGILRMGLVDTSADPILSQSIGQKISFDAEISSEPDVRDTAIRYTVTPVLLEAHIGDDNQKYVPSRSRVLLIAGRFPQYQYGDKINISGKLEAPKNFEGDNGVEFDYVSYLAKDGIDFLIYQPSIKFISHKSGFLTSKLYSLKQHFIKNVAEVVPEPNSSLISGLLFGAKQSLGTDLLDKFKNVGLIHMVVISGYNITIIATAILSAMSYFRRRNLGFGIGVVGIFLFALMVGLTATVLRACIMALIAILARYLGRPTDALRALALAVFLMLIYNPLSLLSDPSFQLSCMATLGLILFSPIIEKFIATKLPFITPKLNLREIIASTFAVQLFLLPLLIRMSGTVSIISFVVNLFILPLTPYAMLLGFLTGLFGFISHYFAWPLGVLSYLLTEIIIRVVEISSSIPFAFFHIGALPIYIVALWYLGYGYLYKKLTVQK